MRDLSDGVKVMVGALGSAIPENVGGAAQTHGVTASGWAFTGGPADDPRRTVCSRVGQNALCELHFLEVTSEAFGRAHPCRRGWGAAFNKPRASETLVQEGGAPIRHDPEGSGQPASAQSRRRFTGRTVLRSGHRRRCGFGERGEACLQGERQEVQPAHGQSCRKLRVEAEEMVRVGSLPQKTFT